jgi:metalloreductase STEAP3
MPEGYAALPSHAKTADDEHQNCEGCVGGCHGVSSSSSSSSSGAAGVTDIEDLVTAGTAPQHYTRSPARPRRDIETGVNEDEDEDNDEDDDDDGELSNAERLQRLMPDVDVVKAFNTVSAYTLKSGIGARLDDRVLVCGDRPAAKELVSRLVHAIGMRPVDAGPLAAAREIERRPLQLFEEWRTAFWMSIALLLAAYAFVAIRDVWLAAEPGQPPKWRDLLLLKFNVVIAWHALALLTLTFGAGVVAALRQLITGTMKRAFPQWLDAWLRARKALGLLGVGSAALHAVAALLTNSLFIDWPYIESREGTEFQGSMLAAILSGGVYAALALTSLPSVAASLSWREWDFMQSKLGHVGLALASVHVLLMSFALGDLPDASLWADRHWLPPVSVLAVAPALLVLAVRLLIVLPPLSGRLARIRGIATTSSSASARTALPRRGKATTRRAGGESAGVESNEEGVRQAAASASAPIRIN